MTEQHNHQTVQTLETGRKVTVVLLASVFLLLNVAALLQSFTSGSIFGDDALLNVTSFLAVLAPLAYGAIIILALNGKPRIAAIFLIPTAVGDIVYTLWLLGIGFSPLQVLPLVSLSDFSPQWWPFSMLQAFELIAIAILALMLLRSPSTAKAPTPTYAQAPLVSPATPGTPMTKASFCPKCGSPAGEGDFCAQCGNALVAQPASAVIPQAATVSTTSSMAVVAFVLSFFIPIVGLILGYISRGEIDRSHGRLTGRGLATAAIVINWISIVFGTLWVITIAVAAANYSSY